ncbi:apolipoprotein N-acyltransferase [Pontibacter pudoricolor]|uniref:apolipoprotein N-acyltransferase n=1 Tax=Pontibacter pudoricolor TaxID=2694930 RepID=UPI001EE4E67C|nr:apolipoprotein N-acyltransferase [Pontibacter pudoricolor]
MNSSLLYRVVNSPYIVPLLALLTGLLLWLGWPTKPMAFFLFFGFVPLLYMEKTIVESGKHKSPGFTFFKWSYVAMVLWNAFTTWWVSHSTLPGGIAAVLFNAALMCIPLIAFYFTRKYLGNTIGYISFVVYWVAFEQFHLNWDLSWPWLTLGNGFATLNTWVQWYEYTGFLGGSVWVLLVNVLIFLVIKNYPQERVELKKLWLPLVLIVVPIVISFAILATYEEKGTPTEVVVVQPNIDPYREKFSGHENFIPYEEQQQRLISLSEQKITPETKFVVWPETALRQDQGYWEEQLHNYQSIQELKDFVNRHPQTELVTGLDSYTFYGDNKDASPTIRHLEGFGYYDSFNSGMHINRNGEIDIYHKSKLVPGVEKLPYPEVFKFLGPLAIDLGGTVGSQGSQDTRDVFYHAQDSTFSAAPVICYESIYGEYVAEYVRNGANLIFVITNDGWWSDSPGYKQHLQYATLRAIETRRSVARAANTGISGFINQKGEITDRSEWWVQDVLSQTILANTELTFYTRHGEYIGHTSLWLALLLFAGAIIGAVINRNKQKPEAKVATRA